jgi:hypothetical protein
VGVDWVHLAQGIIQWRLLTALNLPPLPFKGEEFFDQLNYCKNLKDTLSGCSLMNCKTYAARKRGCDVSGAHKKPQRG